MLLLLATLSTTGMAACVKPTLTSSWIHLPPYMHKDPSGGLDPVGFDVTILNHVSNQLNCPIEWRSQPWNRSMHEIEQGKLDVLAPASYNAKRAKFAWYSAPFRAERMRIVVLKATKEQWPLTSLEDMLKQNFRLSFHLGTWYGPEFEKIEKNPNFQRLLYSNTDNQKRLQMLLHNRVDGVLGEVLSLLLDAKKMGAEDKIAVIDYPIHDNEVHFIFSKKTIPEDFIQSFNQVLKTYKGSSDYPTFSYSPSIK
ncbi:substrate-binding periplasmic protein [Zooshikella sp. RANM57]|uniref:substrate-binding periplasmic protein n=1 Tax=Zooshikella sp. RANM57 TaxID=3425863 RepID=UPI003D6F6CD7